ncbi:MAG: TlpA family protein disulfide reductase [Moheibacter sp.]
MQQIEIEKNIGKVISISSLSFLEKKKHFDDSKPTFINFWFTNCPPCVEEIPSLNELQVFYGEKVNFIAITFDDKEKVKKFLNKFDFQLFHIVNAEKFIDKLKISSFPTNFILNKNQELEFIEGSLPLKSGDEKVYEIVMDKLKQKINSLL